MTLSAVLERRRLILSVGPGGVGKTTTAAALALAAARSGRSSLVCTIDPARRLARALGLQGLGDEPAPVDLGANARPGGAPLWAMMLDAEAALDRLLFQSVQDAETRRRLAAHPLYRVMVRDLPGMHEYAAVSRLGELHQTGRWSVIVLDTPPTGHALDFLDAPMRLMRAMQSPVVSWLVRPYLRAGTLSLKVLRGARAYVLRRLAQIVGTDLLDRMAEFLVLFGSVLDDVRARVDEVSQLLSSEQTGAMVITAPTATNVAEAARVLDALSRRRVRVDALVFNREHALRVRQEVTPERLARALAAEPTVAALAADDQIELLEELMRSHERTRLLARSDHRHETRLLGGAQGPRPHVVHIPLLDDDVHDIAGLERISSYLVGASGAGRPERG